MTRNLNVAIETDQRPHLSGAFLFDCDAHLCWNSLVFFSPFVSSLHDTPLLRF